MMFILTKLLIAILLPPFNIIILWGVSFFFSYLGKRHISQFLRILSCILLYLFSIPYVSKKLINTLALPQVNQTLSDYKQAQAIVVLGGGLKQSDSFSNGKSVAGIPLERMRYASYLYQETSLPILASGGSFDGNPSEAEIMAKEFEQFFHIKVKWIETQSKTTKENALFSQQILERLGIKKIILVTNQWHMRRAKLLFEKVGFEVLPASVMPYQAKDIGIMAFVPQAQVLNNSSIALKEWIGYWKELWW